MQHGTGISPNEVTNIEAAGFWLLLEDREYFVPFAEYPVFRNAKVSEIFRFTRTSPTQVHWPGLDADIELEALAEPERFPLVWREG